MNRIGQIILGLVAAAGILGLMYGAYELLGGDRMRTSRVTDHEARVVLRTWWDGDGNNAWSHDARLDSFGVKLGAEAGVDSLIVKGTLDDSTRRFAVPLSTVRVQLGQD